MAEDFSVDRMTPTVFEELTAEYRTVGVKPIAVYPEVVDGARYRAAWWCVIC